MSNFSRIAVDLGADYQRRDERTGGPRVTHLVNMRVAEPGRLEKTQGYIDSVTYTADGNVGDLLACGVTPQSMAFRLLRSNSSGSAVGAQVYIGSNDSSGGTQWFPCQKLPSQDVMCVNDEEAPTVIPIFQGEHTFYTNCGVVEIPGDRQFVFADSEDELAYHSIHLALVQFGTEKGEVVYRRVQGTSLALGERSWVTSAGKYIAFYHTSTTVRIYYFAVGYISPQFLCTISGVTPTGSSTPLALTYDAAADRLLLVDGACMFWLINGTTGAVTRNATLGAPLVVGLINYLNVAATGYQNHFYVVWYNTPNWSYVIYSISDSAASTVSSGTVCAIAGAPLPNTATICYQPQITAWYNSGYVSQPEGAVVSVYQAPRLGMAAAFSSDLYLLGPSGVIARTTAGFDTFASVAACAPIICPRESESRPIFRTWVYQNSARTIRGAMMLAQSTERYTGPVCYPQIKASVFEGGLYPSTPIETNIGAVQKSAFINYLPPFLATYRKGWLTAILAQKNASSTKNDVYLVIQPTTGQHKLSQSTPSVFQQAKTANGLYLASAIPALLTQQLQGHGTQFVPVTLIGTAAGVGSKPVGTYLYVAILQWRDDAGNVYRSPVSDVCTVVRASVGAVRIDATVDIWDPTWMNETQLRIYRTVANGVTFYLCKEFPSFNPLVFNTWTDTADDSVITTKEVLYTQGARGGIQGLLEWWGMPGCRCCWAGSTRMIAGGLQIANQYRVSNLYEPGEQISWPNHQAFSGTVPEAITAVAEMDDLLLVFSSGKIWGVAGPGPDASGAGSFEPPRVLSSTVGAHSEASLVETPDGIMFQAEDAQIYLLQRGSFQVVNMSAEISRQIGKPIPDYPWTFSPFEENRVDNWVMGAVYDSDKREVWFTERRPRHWVYQVDYRRWHAEMCDADRNYGNFVRSSIGHELNRYGLSRTVPFFVMTSGTTLKLIRCAQNGDWSTYFGQDDGATHRYACAMLNVQDNPNGALRRVWATIWRPLDVGGLSGASLPQCSMLYWFDRGPVGNTPDETRTMIAQNANPQVFMELESVPSRFKCNQFMLCWTDGPYATADNGRHAGISLTGFAFEASGTPPNKGAIRTVAGSGRTG